MNKTPTTLIIMDGFGLSDEVKGNAVRGANTPVLDHLNGEYAHTQLSASGLDVGLPAGQMGNSEVGHTNIGGGRVVFQDLPRISRAIEDGTFFENPAYNAAMDACLEKGTALHLYGLLSNGGVHSTVEHVWALLKMAGIKGLKRVYLHCFLDGRDVSPTSGAYDVIILNLANCDMVGHTGNYDAAVKAVETVDECVGRVVDATLKMGGIAMITADHGNAEQMLQSDGVSPMTAHTTNPVPFILCGAGNELREGRLADIAPTILDVMGLEKPEEMDGQSLILR